MSDFKNYKSCWCVDCKNAKRLPDCPHGCDGMNYSISFSYEKANQI